MNRTKKLLFFIICILFVFGSIAAGSIVDLVEKGDIETVMKMVKKDKTQLDAKNERERSLIHIAAAKGHLDIIEFLVKNGADPNTIDDKGNSPLSNAVSSGHIKAIVMLLKSKADPNGKLEFMGVSPLHIAAGKGYGKIGAMLLKSGANFKALDDSGNTPLFYACRYKNKLMAKALLKAGAEKEDILKIFKKKNPAHKQLEKGTAIIWYTGHSGWAIKTEKNLLIFDYWKRNAISDTPSLMNGAIHPEEIKDLNVSVFISHEHADHYRVVLNI